MTTEQNKKKWSLFKGVNYDKFIDTMLHIGIGMVAYYIIVGFMFGYKYVRKQSYKPKNALFGAFISFLTALYAIKSNQRDSTENDEASESKESTMEER